MNKETSMKNFKGFIDFRKDMKDMRGILKDKIPLMNF